MFGGTLNKTIQAGISEGQPLHFSDQFRTLSADLAAARSQAPIPSASGAFRFEWNEELDTFVRGLQSLGPVLAERAQTLGRHTATLSVSYTHIDFDTLDGKPLNHLSFSQSALSESLLANLPPEDQAKFGNDQLRTQLDLGLAFDLFFFSAAFGITDFIDVSLALSVNRAQMRATALTTIEGRNGPGNAFFFGRTFDWLTLTADFLGFHDDKRDGVNDDVIQSAVGFKVNPFGEVVIAGNFQFPLNRDGLRADVIYTGQIEYTF